MQTVAATKQKPKAVKTQSAIVTQAREIGAKLKTAEQANAAVKSSYQTLKKAVQYCEGYRFVDRAAGLVEAEMSRINQQVARLRTLNERPFDRAKADSVGLAVLQSAQLLGDLKKAATEREAQNTLQSYMDDFAAALKSILEAAAKVASDAMPNFLLWGVAGYFLLKMNKRR